MKNNVLLTVAGGAWIGGTMTVPGVSGGSMAMILGLYDRLISSVNGVFDRKKRRDSIVFLIEFLIGAAVGFFLFARLIDFLLQSSVYSVPTRFFFLGAVAGGAPMIFRSAGVKRFRPAVVLYPILGIAAALLIAAIPKGLLVMSGEGFAAVVRSILIQLLGGLIVAIALVLPGISVSQMLAVLGVYDPLIGAASELDIPTLLTFIPLVIGTVVGIFLTTGILERAMKKYPMASYLIVFGFVLGSLPELFPGVPSGWSILYSALAAALGFLALYFVSGIATKRS